MNRMSRSEANLASGAPDRMADAGNPGYPDEWRGSLFNWPEVTAAELLDDKALGYEYDSLPAPE